MSVSQPSLEFLIKDLSLPNASAWGEEGNDLDENHARKIFFGKNIEQTFPLFERNAIERADEIRFMPEQCFPYYLIAFASYLMLESTKENIMAPDAASSFLNLVIDQLLNAPHKISGLMEKILPVADYLASHQNEYDADIEIYGSFFDKLKEIKKLMNSG